jgi:hypothetical protein
MNFTSFSQNTQRLKIHFARRPLDVLDAHSYAIGLHQTPWKELGPRNVVLGAMGRRSWWNSGEVLAPERVGEGEKRA